MTRLRLTSRSRRAPASSAVSWIGVPSGRNATVPGSTMAEVHRGEGPPSMSQAVVPRCSPSKPSVTWPETSSRRPEGSKAIDSPPGEIDPAGRRSSPWSEASARSWRRSSLRISAMPPIARAASSVQPRAWLVQRMRSGHARAIRTGCPAPSNAFRRSPEAIRAASRALRRSTLVQTTATDRLRITASMAAPPPITNRRCRCVHFQIRSARLGRRACTGSPPRNLARSSASSFAVA